MNVGEFVTHASQRLMQAADAGPSRSRADGTRTYGVLFVDDDTLYAQTLALELETRGFNLRHFADGDSFLAALDVADEADIIVLDWHLPKIPGIELLAAIRRRGVKVPVVFLTGRNIIAYENQAFDRGATDFVDKSRGVEILVRRLRRAIEAASEERQSCHRLTHGGLRLYRRVSRALWNGIDPDLTLGEYNIVELLVLNAGNYMRYRTIYDVLRVPGFIAGKGPEGYRANVRSAIKRTRNKFRTIDPAFSEIESYMGFGYRWRSAEHGNPQASTQG